MSTARASRYNRFAMGPSLSKGRPGARNGGTRGTDVPLPPAIFGQVSEPQALRWFGRISGALFIAGALLPVPSTLLLDPRPELAAYGLTAVVLLTGIACFLLPWDRASVNWLHAIAALATLQVAATVALFDWVFSVLYIVVAVLVAYGFGRPRAVLPHIALISIALVAPAAYDPDQAREAWRVALLLIPSVWMLAGALVFLRTQVDTRERAYRQFAEQALTLSERITGRSPVRLGAAPPARSLAKREPLPPPPPRRWRTALAALAGAAVVVPLSFAGLAAAGVELPGAVVEPFESVGITLPNQDGEAEESASTTSTAASTTAAEGSSEARTARGESNARPKAQDRKRRDRSSAQGQAAAPGAPATNVTPATPAPTVEGETSGPAGDGGAASGGGAADATDGPVKSILGDVGEILEEPLLPLIGQGSKPRD